MVRITVVCDNNVVNPKLLPSWGFSCLVEVGGRRILFDTSGDGARLLYNMGVLGVDPRFIDTVVLSHNHWDHTGGLSSLLTINPCVDVYMPTPRNETISLGNGVYIPPPLRARYRDYELWEQYLVIDLGKRIAVITGCSHPGIVEIATSAFNTFGKKIALLLGGWHLVDKRIDQIVEILRRLSELDIDRFAPCHCTGERAIGMAKQMLRDRVLDVGAGFSIEL